LELPEHEEERKTKKSPGRGQLRMREKDKEGHGGCEVVGSGQKSMEKLHGSPTQGTIRIDCLTN
jgi:hypothetical protein